MTSPDPGLAAGGLEPLIALSAEHLPPVALAAARLVPVVWLAPIFGGRLLPVRARLIMAVGLAWVVAHPAEGVEVDLIFAFRLAIEALIGTCIGLLASLPFELARSGGHIVDVVRGAAFAQVIAPGLGDRATPTGDVLYLALLAAATACGGDRLLIVALTTSFGSLPAGAMIDAASIASFGEILIQTTASLISSALLLAAPAIIVALLTDTVLGLVGRVVPQLPLFFLGMPLKTVLCLMMVALAAGPMLGALLDQAALLPNVAAEMVDMIGGRRG